MIPLIRRLFLDDVYLEQVARAGIGAVGLALSSGVIDLAELNAHLGAIGWWLGRVLVVLALWIRAGDKNDTPAERPS